MAIEEDIEEFHQWAIKLGCPGKAIPNNEALKSIFKSRQHEIFRNLMRRVQPLQIVQDAHDNITINQAEKVKHQIVPLCQRSFLSKRMQTYLKFQDLIKVHKAVKLQYEEHKADYDKIASTIKAMNIQVINCAHKKKVLKGLTTVLKIKLEQLDKQLLKEGEIKEQIQSTIPVKLSAFKDCENAAMNVVEKALNELQIFYAKTEDNNNPNGPQSTMDELWQKMRKILGNVPNSLLFKVVMRLKEEQLLHIMSLNEQDHNHYHQKADDVNGSHVTNNKLEISAFDMKLLNTKTELLAIVAKYLQAQTKRIDIEQRFSITYMEFVEELREKVLLFNSDDNDDVDEQISDFLVQFNLRNMKRSQNDFLNHQIDQLKIEIDNASKHLEHHELILGDVKKMYVAINLSINRVQYEITQLGQIKDKILYSKNMLKHMVNEKALLLVGAKQNIIFNTNAMRMQDVTIGGGDSFELCGDNVFCSTKLDFDATSLNNTLCPVAASSDCSQLPASGGRFILPPHLAELTTFLERPLQHYSFLSGLCAFYLKPCPLITENRELNSIIQLVPGLLLSPYYALLEVQDRINLSQALDAVSQKLILDIKCVSVDVHILKERRKEQHEQMAESLDKTERTIASLKHLLQKSQKLYDFILENPVGRFIPATKRFKNYTYTEYETEFLRYQRMVGASI